MKYQHSVLKSWGGMSHARVLSVLTTPTNILTRHHLFLPASYSKQYSSPVVRSHRFSCDVAIIATSEYFSYEYVLQFDMLLMK